MSLVLSLSLLCLSRALHAVPWSSLSARQRSREAADVGTTTTRKTLLYYMLLRFAGHRKIAQCNKDLHVEDESALRLRDLHRLRDTSACEKSAHLFQRHNSIMYGAMYIALYSTI